MSKIFVKVLVISVFVRAVAVLLGGLSDLVQHELWDRVGECGCHGQHVRFGLVTILIGNELHDDGSAVRGGVTER